MGPLDLMGWALGIIAFTLAMAVVGVTVVIFTRFLEEQRANLATHRAKQAQLAAEARAAEQRAELEAADVLERRIALPSRGGATEAELIHARLDRFAETVQRMQGEHQELRRAVHGTTAVREQRTAVVHTDTPLRAGEES